MLAERDQDQSQISENSFDKDVRHMGEKWNESLLLSSDVLADLLLSEEFGQKVGHAITRTLDTPDSRFSKEHGFIVLNKELQRPSLRISHVIEGEYDSIDFNQLSSWHQKEVGKDAKRVFDFHTHPGNSPKSAFSVAFPHLSFKGSDEFSDGDLLNFYETAHNVWSGIISAIGYTDKAERNPKVLLISFNNFESFRDFNAETLYYTTVRSKLSNPISTPIQLYEQAGLNVAVLAVDLISSTPFDSTEVLVASNLLTSRKELKI